MLEGVARETYEFENITYASRMSFFDLYAIHAKSFYEEKFVTSYAPPIFIPECVPLACDLCYSFDHNSDSCPHYVRLKGEIENRIKIAFIQ